MNLNEINLAQAERNFLEPDEPIMSKVKCYGCGDELYKGEQYTTINGHIYCSCCIAEKENEELLKLYGIKLEWEEA